MQKNEVDDEYEKSSNKNIIINKKEFIEKVKSFSTNNKNLEIYSDKSKLDKNLNIPNNNEDNTDALKLNKNYNKIHNYDTFPSNEVKNKDLDHYNVNLEYNSQSKIYLNNCEKELINNNNISKNKGNNNKSQVLGNSEKSTLDCYLDSAGYNKFQIFMILIVCYIFFVDGSEMIIINLTLSSIQRDWKISTMERSILSSAVFFGFFLGSLFSGYLTNKYGRKKPTLLGVSIIWIFTTLTTLTNNFYTLFTVRFFVGVGIGFVVTSLTSLITELIPTYYRSFVLNMLWIFYPVGIIYICIISMFHIKDKEFLDWKKITLINSYSSLLMVILCLFLYESPRYLLLKRNYEKAFEILKKIGYSRGIVLSEDDKEKIILESQILEEANKNKGNFDIKTFTEKTFLKVSVLLSYLWFITSLISYGLLYILPKIFDNLSNHNKLNSLLHMIYSMLILTFCPFFRGIISEMKSLGRKNSMILGFSGAGVACLFCILNQSYISISSGLLKFFINTSLGIVCVYTSEVYPTNIRTIALGFGNSITRLGGILTPFICELVETIIPKGPFWLFIIGSLTGVIGCLALPYETMGMVLDQIPTTEKTEKEENSDSKQNNKY